MKKSIAIGLLLASNLWYTTINAQTPAMVKDINAGFNSAFSSPSGAPAPFNGINVNGVLYFAATDGVNGRELWKSDGTSVGTIMVKDINVDPMYLDPAEAEGAPSNFYNLNGTVYFFAYDGINSNAGIWKSDGTDAGSVKLKDLVLHSGFTNWNVTLYFVADDGINGRELWKTDGTSAGTTMVKDIFSGAGSANPSSIISVNGALYFTANDGVNGIELWKTDGTSAGTTMVKDIFIGANGADPLNLINVLNGTLMFIADDGINGAALWKSDGTATGTVMVKDINPNTNANEVNSHSLYARYFTNFNDTLYFSANDSVHGSELWKSDGTTNGTVLVSDITSGIAGSYPFSFFAFNNKLYFTTVLSNGNNTLTGLWKTDGTTSGTSLFKPFVVFDNVTNVNGTLYFSANDGTGISGTELWKSDGTITGTIMVKDIWPGANTSNLAHLTNYNNTLYFTANDDISYGTQLWKSDGSATGTIKLSEITNGISSYLIVVSDTLYFTADDLNHGNELWSYKPLVSTTGISPANDLIEKNEFIVFPNPSTNYCNISSSFSGNSIIEMYDLQGRKMMSQTVLLQAKSAFKIDLSTLTKGIYFVKIYNGDKIHTRKIIVQ